MAEYTYRIEEEFDRRLGQTVFCVYARPVDGSGESLIGEYNTRSEAREGVKRAVARDSKATEAT